MPYKLQRSLFGTDNINVKVDFERQQYLQKNSYVINTAGHCPPSWIFGRPWCRPLSVEVV